jgi:hypothetical protein
LVPLQNNACDLRRGIRISDWNQYAVSPRILQHDLFDTCHLLF